MFRRLGFLLVVVGALAVVPAGSAAYPTPFAVQDTAGVRSLDGSLLFIAHKSGDNTRVSAVTTNDGTTVKSQTVDGAFGIPRITQNGLMGGLFHDGSALVLQSMGIGTTSRFLILGSSDLATRDTITLKGTFGFDALSPDGSRLYLIQHTSKDDLQHYVVRAYDLSEHSLLAGRIADKTQKSWVMQGFAVNRASTDDGRWVYTLYANPGGFPFIHALDTMRGVAHCVGLPWRSSNQGPVFNFGLSVKGKYLEVRRQDGRLYRLVDRSNWRLSTKPTAS
jgi:hypothetical protein